MDGWKGRTGPNPNLPCGLNELAPPAKARVWVLEMFKVTFAFCEMPRPANAGLLRFYGQYLAINGAKWC